MLRSCWSSTSARLHRFARCASTRVVAPKAPLTAWQPYVKHAVSPWRTVPAHIARPPYADTGDVPECMHNPMEIKNDKQIAAMRRACAIADETRAHVGQFVKPGVSTDELDLIVHDFIIKRGAFPSPLNYRGFPKSMCASVNDILCHGIPDHRKLIDGDIVSIDISCFIDGVHGDCCGTFLVGNVAPETRAMVDFARKCTAEAVAICGPSVPLQQIGLTIDKLCAEAGYGSAIQFTGHGIGSDFHTFPAIYHTGLNFPGRDDIGVLMKPGLVFTIEPIIIQLGKNGRVPQLYMLEDNWTVGAQEPVLSVQFEDTVLITETGVEILTKQPAAQKSVSL